MVARALSQAYGSQSSYVCSSQLVGGNNQEMWPFFSGEATAKYGLVPAMTSCTPWWHNDDVLSSLESYCASQRNCKK